MIITQASLDALRLQFEKRFGEAYGQTEVWWPKLATEIPSSTKSNIYGWVAQQAKMREWVGPRVALNLAEHSYTLVNKTYEATIELDRDEVEDDNLGLFTNVAVPQLAQATKKHVDQLLKTLIQANPVGFDGVTFFNDAHPKFDEAAGTYDNLFAGLTLTADNFNTAWGTMVAYTGEDGEVLGVMPTHVIVPPQLKKAALEIFNSTLIVGQAGAENVLKGWCDVIVVPELSNQASTWYLADLSKPLKPFIFQNRKPDQFVSRDAPTDPKVFDQRKFTYGVDARRNVGVTLPFLMAKCN